MRWLWTWNSDSGGWQHQRKTLHDFLRRIHCEWRRLQLELWLARAVSENYKLICIIAKKNLFKWRDSEKSQPLPLDWNLSSQSMFDQGRTRNCDLRAIKSKPQCDVSDVRSEQSDIIPHQNRRDCYLLDAFIDCYCVHNLWAVHESWRKWVRSMSGDNNSDNKSAFQKLQWRH